MFEDIITLFIKEYDKATRKDTFVKQVIHEVFYDSISSLTSKKHGVEKGFEATIIIPDISIKIKAGDIIAKGEVDNKELGYTVKKVDYKDFGGLQHIEVLL